MTSPRLIVFDVDGTLIDSQEMIIAAMGEAYGSLNLPVPTREAVRGIIGLSLPQAMRGLTADADEATISRLVEAYRASFVTRRSKGYGEGSVTMFDGARECLSQLNAIGSNVLGIATGKARRGLDVLIEAHNLDGIFATIQTADQHPSKPNPAMLEVASGETGILPENAVMIGDTSYDMEMGKAAGFKTIGVAWGYHARSKIEPCADVIVDEFAEIKPAVDRLLGDAA